MSTDTPAGNTIDHAAQEASGVQIGYIVANPSSYLYFNDDRSVAGTTDQFEIPDSSACTTYNDYHYGLLSMNSYMSTVGASQIISQYPSRKIAYLLGENDNDPNGSDLDTSCSAMFQGDHRLERGITYYNYLQYYFGAGITSFQLSTVIPGVGHSSYRIFTSEIGRHYLFNIYWADPEPTPPSPATMTSPADGSTLGGESQTFTWTSVPDATYYTLRFGTSPGFNDIAYISAVTATSYNVTGLPTDGSAIYVRLWTKIGGAWYYYDYVYTAASGSVKNDFDGDGKSDILWRHATSGTNVAWFMTGLTVASSGLTNYVTNYQYSIAGMGDFDGDGKTDILWRHDTSGANVIWLMNGLTVTTSGLTNYVTNYAYSIAGMGDFDGNGTTDILWRHDTSGMNVIWFMNGLTVTSTGVTNYVTNYQYSIAGMGDFDGDGKTDIMWRHDTSGMNVIWLMNGLNVTTSGLTNYVTNYQYSIAGMGDFDGDGKTDILWRHDTSGMNLIWLMNGVTVASSGVTTYVTNYNFSLTAVGDFDGDGKSDILWRPWHIRDERCMADERG